MAAVMVIGNDRKGDVTEGVLLPSMEALGIRMVTVDKTIPKPQMTALTDWAAKG